MGKSSSKKWEYDPGSIPGEPLYYYLDVGADLDDADAVIIDTDTDPPFYEAFGKNRNFIGRFTNVEEAQRVVENWVKESKVRDMLEPLRKKLIDEFPPRHWNHLNVFSKFWSLYDAIAIKKGGHLKEV